MVAADALHTQRDHTRFLAEEKNAHFILVVKKNQPSLYHQLKQLPGGRSGWGTSRNTMARPHRALGSGSTGRSRPCT